MNEWHSRLVNGGFSQIPDNTALVEVEYEDGETMITTGWCVRNSFSGALRWRLFEGVGWHRNFQPPPNPESVVEFITHAGAQGVAKVLQCRWTLTGSPGDIAWWRYAVWAPAANGCAASVPEPKHSHYFKDVSKLQTIDVYRVLSLYEVTDPCLQHAVKKLLVAGGRGGGKDIRRDVQEAIDTLTRWQAMQAEMAT